QFVKIAVLPVSIAPVGVVASGVDTALSKAIPSLKIQSLVSQIIRLKAHLSHWRFRRHPGDKVDRPPYSLTAIDRRGWPFDHLDGLQGIHIHFYQGIVVIDPGRP